MADHVRESGQCECVGFLGQAGNCEGRSTINRVASMPFSLANGPDDSNATHWRVDNAVSKMLQTEAVQRCSAIADFKRYMHAIPASDPDSA